MSWRMLLAQIHYLWTPLLRKTWRQGTTQRQPPGELASPTLGSRPLDLAGECLTKALGWSFHWRRTPECPNCRIFFRPTPLGFRQVVQHVRLHVAEISELINWRKDGRLLIEWPQKWTGGGPIHSPKCRHNSVTKQKPKNKTKPKKKHKQNKPKHTAQKQTEKGKSDRQTSYVTSVIE